MATISILDIVEDTTVDGPGFRTTVYCAGCPNRCPGCHNPQSWDITNGKEVDIEDILDVILADPFADVTFSGGGKNIWCYTGYLFEDLLGNVQQRELLNYIDVLVDGRFVEVLKDETLRFRGSSNQRVINVSESLKRGSVVLLDI